MEWIEALDQGTANWLTAHQVTWLHRLMQVVTHLGNSALLGGLVAALLLGVILAWLVWRQRYPWPVWRSLFRAGVLLAAALVSCALIDGISFAHLEGVKGLVARPRPPTSSRPSWSFPSGHAFSSAAIYGTLALLAAARLPHLGQRRVVLAGGLTVVFLIGVSRLYLGEHWLTDVLGGWAGGFGCALLFAWLDQFQAANASQTEAAAESLHQP